MVDTPNPDADTSAEQPADDAVVTVENGADGAEAVDAAETEAADVDVAALREALEASKEETLRALAEAQNIRRRAAIDVENAHKYGLEKFAASLLPVVDSLEKAIESASADGADLASVTEGVGITLNMLTDALGKAGVTPVDPHGEPFDPQFHEAMTMIESPDAEPNSVLEVLVKGYTLNERLLRAAMVVVARGPAGDNG